ncbi:MAG: hypothetical protein ABIR54_08240 [Burkholderiaceae bacterium]
MKHAHPQRSTARHASGALLVTVALACLASSAQARNVRLMGSVDDATRLTHVHDILGNLELHFGSDSVRGASIVRRDVVVKGVGTTNLNDVHVDDAKARPADQDLCARAFEDAVTQLAFAARGARATAIVGVVSAYEGKVFDDPVHYECHVGALKAAVTLRAQLVRGAVDVPVLVPPPAPAALAPAPIPVAPDAPPPPAATFQPLPPRPAPAPN